MRLLSLAPRALVLLALTATLGAGAPAPVQDDALGRVAAGLLNADADAVLADSGDRVEIVLFGQGGMFRRAQATHVLRDFFRRYPPERVVFGEPSASDDGQSATGRYLAQTGGQPLVVRVFHRADGDAWELASIRIDQRSAARPSGR